jgi:hypothetical protein
MLRYARVVNPAIFFPIAGAVLLVWGTIVAIFNQWAARLGKKTQSIYGQRASDMVTPRYMRFIGICLAVGGVLFIVLSLAGFFPNHA